MRPCRRNIARLAAPDSSVDRALCKRFSRNERNNEGSCFSRIPLSRCDANTALASTKTAVPTGAEGLLLRLAQHVHGVRHRHVQKAARFFLHSLTRRCTFHGNIFICSCSSLVHRVKLIFSTMCHTLEYMVLLEDLPAQPDG